jgi:transcriptional regulator with XRE-family HTH domain
MKSRGNTLDVNGEAFFNARDKKRLSQDELAKELCLSGKHIAELEANKCVVFFSYNHRQQVAKKVAIYLGISEDEAFIHPNKPESSGAANAEITTISSSTELPNPEDSPIKLSLRFSSPETSDEIKSQPESEANTPEPVKPVIKDRAGWRHKRIAFVSLAFGIVAGVLYTSADSYESFLEPRTNSPATTTRLDTPQIPVEVEVQQETPAKEATSKTPTIPTPTLSASDSCSIKAGTPFSYSNPNPSKPSNYVYIAARDKATFCVVDADGVLTNTTLESGTSRSIYGKPPFLVVPDNFSAVDIFYEGNKLWNLPPDTKSLRLGSKI